MVRKCMLTIRAAHTVLSSRSMIDSMFTDKTHRIAFEKKCERMLLGSNPAQGLSAKSYCGDRKAVVVVVSNLPVAETLAKPSFQALQRA